MFIYDISVEGSICTWLTIFLANSCQPFRWNTLIMSINFCLTRFMREQIPLMLKRKNKLLKNKAVKWAIVTPIACFGTVGIILTYYKYSVNRRSLFKFYFRWLWFSPHITLLARCSMPVRMELDPNHSSLPWLHPSVIFYYANPIAPCVSVSPINDLGISGMDELA